MKLLILIGVLSILGMKSSYANIGETMSDALATTLPEKAEPKKRLPSTPNDRIARSCLITVADLQEAYLKANGKYAADVNALQWPDEECFKNFSFTVHQADQQKYLIQVKNKKVAWQIDQDNIMTKIVNL